MIRGNWEIEMRKTPVFRVAFLLVLACSLFIGAKDPGGSPPHNSAKTFCSLDGSHCSNHREIDRDASSPRQGAADNPSGSVKSSANEGGGSSNDLGQDK